MKFILQGTSNLEDEFYLSNKILKIEGCKFSLWFYIQCKSMVISRKNRLLSNWMPKLGDKVIEQVADYKYR